MCTLSTPGPAVRLNIHANRSSLFADGMQVLQLEAELLDARNRPAKDEVIHCQVLGSLTLLGLENGRPDDLTPYSEPFRLSGESTLTAYFRAGTVPGPAVIRFRTDSGLSAERRMILR